MQNNVKSIANCRHRTSQDKDKDKDQDKVQDKAENFSRRCFVGSEVNRLKRCSTQPEQLLCPRKKKESPELTKAAYRE